MTNPLDPQAEYNVPGGESRYMNFEQGQNTFMPLASAIVGYIYWTFVDGKNVPVCFAEKVEDPSSIPGIKYNEQNQIEENHFWAFPVWDYATKSIKVLEITQKGIMKSVLGFVKNEAWGAPALKYSFTITKEGEKLSTKYQTMANPPTELPSEIGQAWDAVQKENFDINRLFDGGDPFKDEKASDIATGGAVDPR